MLRTTHLTCTAFHPRQAATFPREGPGLNYDANWALAASGVAPDKDCWYNADARTLIQHASGKLTAEKALEASIGASPAANVLSNGADAPGYQPIHPFDAEDLVAEVRDHEKGAC